MSKDENKEDIEHLDLNLPYDPISGKMPLTKEQRYVFAYKLGEAIGLLLLICFIFAIGVLFALWVL